METTDWKNMSNSEIEVKLKEMEFDYEKTKSDILKLYDKLNQLNKDYIDGSKFLEKRLNPNKKR